MKKQYHGRRDKDGRAIVTVEFTDVYGNVGRVYPLVHFNRYPVQFDWHNTTNGSAELAKSIMIDYMAYADDAEGMIALDKVHRLADRYWHEFQKEIVARLPEGEWTIKESLIEAWVASKEPVIAPIGGR